MEARFMMRGMEGMARSSGMTVDNNGQQAEQVVS